MGILHQLKIEEKEAFNKFYLLKSLVILKLEPNGDIEEYIKNKSQLQRRLADCGLKLEYVIMAVLLLVELPFSMVTFIRILENNSQISLEKVGRELQRNFSERSHQSYQGALNWISRQVL
jgi:hypothetical protein